MARQSAAGWACGWLVSPVFWSWIERKLWFPWPFSKRKKNCARTFGSRAPATFSESAELSCACPIFRRKKFAEPTRYAVQCGLVEQQTQLGSRQSRRGTSTTDHTAGITQDGARHSGRLRLKMQKIHRVNLVRLNLLKSREIIERHWICPRRKPARSVQKKIWRRLRERLSRAAQRHDEDSLEIHSRPLNRFIHIESIQPGFQVLSNGHESIQRTRFNGFKFNRRRPVKLDYSVGTRVCRCCHVTGGLCQGLRPNSPSRDKHILYSRARMSFLWCVFQRTTFLCLCIAEDLEFEDSR